MCREVVVIQNLLKFHLFKCDEVVYDRMKTEETCNVSNIITTNIIDREINIWFKNSLSTRNREKVHVVCFCLLARWDPLVQEGCAVIESNGDVAQGGASTHLSPCDRQKEVGLLMILQHPFFVPSPAPRRGRLSPSANWAGILKDWTNEGQVYLFQNVTWEIGSFGDTEVTDPRPVPLRACAWCGRPKTNQIISELWPVS